MMKNGKEGESIVTNNLIFITPDNQKWYSLDDLPNEKWLDITNYEGLYQISNYGRIKSLSKYKSRRVVIMKPYKDKWYRYVIKLYKRSCAKSFYVHRLVGIHFIPNPDNKPEINHKTPINPTLCDNRYTELEWCTSSENSRYTILCGNHYSPSKGLYGISNHRSKPIVQLTMKGEFMKKWVNAREIDEELGIDFRYVSRCCTHQCKSAHGYKFIFEEEYNNEQLAKNK